MLYFGDSVFGVMDGVRRFGIHYIRRRHSSPPRDGQSEIQGIVKQLDVLVIELNQNHKRTTQLISNPRFEKSVILLF